MGSSVNGDSTFREFFFCCSDEWHRNVVVIDFGLARDFKKSSTGVMGTPGYMPPEAGGGFQTTSSGSAPFFSDVKMSPNRCGRKAFGPFMEISFPWAPWL